MQDADLGREEDEDQNTIFIDNLPSDEFDIRKQLVEVDKQIKMLEYLFFEEEDSEREENLKKITNVAIHE